MKVVCITNDVEATTITGEAYNDNIARRITKEALPIVLDLYREYNVRATFFCQGSLVEQYPEIVQMIENDGHEVACHGWIHDSDKAYDILHYAQQVNHLKRAKDVIEKYAKHSIVSFRAPALRVNEYTPMALKETGFKYDSSIAPQRLDAFMSLGSKKKLQWICAPRRIYETSITNLARIGYSGIVEIPVSAFGVPYISTIMRISPIFSSIVRWLLRMETFHGNKKVITFLFHPSEVLENQLENSLVVRRSQNQIVHFFAGILRSRLKQRNLGNQCLKLLEKELIYWKEKGYEFKTIKEIKL